MMNRVELDYEDTCIGRVKLSRELVSWEDMIWTTKTSQNKGHTYARVARLQA